MGIQILTMNDNDENLRLNKYLSLQHICTRWFWTEAKGQVMDDLLALGDGEAVQDVAPQAVPARAKRRHRRTHGLGPGKTRDQLDNAKKQLSINMLEAQVGSLTGRPKICHDISQSALDKAIVAFSQIHCSFRSAGKFIGQGLLSIVKQMCYRVTMWRYSPMHRFES